MAALSQIVADRLKQLPSLGPDRVFRNLAEPEAFAGQRFQDANAVGGEDPRLDGYVVVIADPDAIRETRESQTVLVDVHAFGPDPQTTETISNQVREALHNRDLPLPHGPVRRWALVRADSRGIPEELPVENLESRVERYQVYAVKAD